MASTWDLRRDNARFLIGPKWCILPQSLGLGVVDVAINVKLSDNLVFEAKRSGKIYHRSLPKQIEYWSHMGKIAEENPDLPFSVIKDILIAREEDATEEYVFD